MKRTLVVLPVVLAIVLVVIQVVVAADPEVSVSQSEVSAELGRDMTSTYPLVIHNGGDAEATWQVLEDDTACDSPSDIPILSVSPTEGTIASGDSTVLEVIVDSTGLAPADYSANLCVFVGDQLPAVQVPVYLRVLPILIDPENMLVVLAPDWSSTHPLTLYNPGLSIDVTWHILEDDTACDSPSDIPILSVSLTEGTIASGDSTVVDVTFDATGLAPADYSANLCVFVDEPWPAGVVQVPMYLMVRDSVTVVIDIKPGSDPNCFNSDSHGVIPVAILSTADFDAATVDPFSVALDGAGVRVKGKSGNAGSLEDVNGDGLLDLVVQIIDDAGYEPGDTTAYLTGTTFDGILVEGTDSICIVP